MFLKLSFLPGDVDRDSFISFFPKLLKGEITNIAEADAEFTSTGSTLNAADSYIINEGPALSWQAHDSTTVYTKCAGLDKYWSLNFEQYSSYAFRCVFTGYDVTAEPPAPTGITARYSESYNITNSTQVTMYISCSNNHLFYFYGNRSVLVSQFTHDPTEGFAVGDLEAIPVVSSNDWYNSTPWTTSNLDNGLFYGLRAYSRFDGLLKNNSWALRRPLGWPGGIDTYLDNPVKYNFDTQQEELLLFPIECTSYYHSAGGSVTDFCGMYFAQNGSGVTGDKVKINNVDYIILNAAYSDMCLLVPEA